MKTLSTLRSLAIALALIAGVPGAWAQSTTSGSSGSQVVIYYQNVRPLIPIQLATLTNEVAPVTAFTVSNTVSARFFRLMALPATPPAGMALIPAGWFTMGNSIGDSDITDAVPTNIYVSGFYMDTNLVSYGLLTNVEGYATANGYSFVNPGNEMFYRTNGPAESIDWYDSVKWCNARSQQAGLTPVYYTDAGFTQVYKTGETDNLFVNWNANGYRLPTEAEWEKAARGGLIGRRLPWGNLISESQANYIGDTNDYSYDRGPNGYNPTGNPVGAPFPSPVGSFDMNGYGLYDMAGNMGEWCWDWYGVPYGQPSTINPTGPATGSSRVARGGFWFSGASVARCAYRYGFSPGGIVNYIGFRCVRGL